MKRMQSGRSMIEILGVLAIASILALFGIYWYTTAMNKHKAIEILTEAHKRAVVVAAAIGTGGQGEWDSAAKAYAFSLEDFGNEPVAGATFDSEAWHSFSEIEIPLSGVSKEVCAQMKALAGDSKQGISVIDGDCDTAATKGLIVVFNDDLETDLYQINCDHKPNICAGCQSCQNGKCVDTQAKCNGVGTCSGGICLCADGRGACSGVCCTGSQICYAGTCQTYDAQDNKCVTNDDCEEGYYCYNNTPWDGSYVCSTFDGYGTCRRVPAPASWQEITWRGRKLYKYTAGGFSWWNARSLCLKAGHQFASMARVGLHYGLTRQEQLRLIKFLGWDVYWLEDEHTAKVAYFIWPHTVDGESVVSYGAGHEKCGYARVLCTD